MSSESSDNENLDLLREAQDSQFLQENLYWDNKDRSNYEVVQKQISLRTTKDESEQFNCLKVTPEFRNFVARQLTKLLDKKLETDLEYDASDKGYKKKRKSNGIRLFSHSEKSLKLEKSSDTSLILWKNKSNLKHNLKKKLSVTKEELRVLTVSGEDILSKKDTKHWCNRSKSKIFTYKESQNGLELIEDTFK